LIDITCRALLREERREEERRPEEGHKESDAHRKLLRNTRNSNSFLARVTEGERVIILQEGVRHQSTHPSSFRE
jgi:hypothetical protein